MTGPEAVVVRTMREDDLPQADDLRAVAGWNQMPGDWLRILRYQPDGCFVAIMQNAVVGTVTTTSYSSVDTPNESVSLAWIGMMLVHPDCRRQGIASALMQQALTYLNATGVQCIKLDATPAGEPVYERLGFQPEWRFHRWQKSADAPSATVRPSTLGTLPAESCPELDLAAFGVNRGLWLDALAADSAVVVKDNGFGMLRSGRNAAYLGPITAATTETAAALVKALLSDLQGPVYWDIPAPNSAAAELARAYGFEPVRDLTRMWTGRHLLNPELQYQFALSDPGTG